VACSPPLFVERQRKLGKAGPEELVVGLDRCFVGGLILRGETESRTRGQCPAEARKHKNGELK
jgi:hypothetical protein